MYANVNGVKLFFDVEGLQFVPDGPEMKEKPVCFVLHGGPGGDHTHFMPALSPLAEIMQLVYIDDRSCGRSERVDINTSSIKQNVDDIEALREYLGLDKIFILGQSYGGFKAQKYIIDYPEHLYGAILASTSPNADDIDNARIAEHVKEYGNEEQYRIWTSNAVATGEVTFSEYMEIMGPLYHGKDKFDLKEAIDSNMRGIKTDEVVQHQMLGELASMESFNMIPGLKEVDLPCLIMCGERDFITDYEANKDIHEAIRNSEFHVLKDASHEIFADYPEIVFPIIEEFVNKNFK